MYAANNTHTAHMTSLKANFIPPPNNNTQKKTHENPIAVPVRRPLGPRKKAIIKPIIEVRAQTHTC